MDSDLQAHVDMAVADFDSGALRMQTPAADQNSALAAMYRGDVIDAAAGRATGGDPALQGLYITNQP